MVPLRGNVALVRNFLSCGEFHSIVSQVHLLFYNSNSKKLQWIYACHPRHSIQVKTSLETLHSQESGSPVVFLGGDFNLPDISWNEGYGSVNSNPAYGLEINNSLLDIANDYHLL